MSTTSASPGSPTSHPADKGSEQYFWVWILCLLGLDYFSTLAYQPSITYQETARLGPLATAAVVLVTLLGALPVYCYLAGRSPGGQGSLGVVERLIRGWRGKTLVLILLGFAATDFTMLKSLSLADASVHVLNKHDGDRLESARQLTGWVKVCVRDYCSDDLAIHVNEQLIVTILLSAVTFTFWYILRKGFTRNALYLAVPLVILYLLLTAIVILAGLWYLVQRPEIFTSWIEELHRGEFQLPNVQPGESGWGRLALLSLLALPNLALGLSGFEMSMILMPQVEGKPGEEPPRTRIFNTRKVLIASAVIMSLYLLGSVLVTTLLIPGDELRAGNANNRALAYLAHGGRLAFDEPLGPIFGFAFGTLYDIVTVLVLCLAGTSVMTALSVLLPQFLLRFGMELRWTQRWGVLLMVFAGINMAITLWFQASVEEQRGAYATGVMVLIACAAVVSALSLHRLHDYAVGWAHRTAWWFAFVYYAAIALVLVTTMLAVAMRPASGVGIALCFIAAILAMSIVSRAWRADELRTVGFEFKDEQSKFLWDSLRLADFPVLVPVDPVRETRDDKEQQIRTQHQLTPEADIVFLEVCVDDPSDFYQRLEIEVMRDNNRYVIRVTNCVSLAHAIAAIALEMSRYSKPPGLHFGWPEKNMLSASWSYLAFGEGNTPWKVRELIYRAEPDPAKRPRVIVG